MFWGLIMEPNKRYSQIVENSFHVSMASLDPTTADNDAVQVMLGYGNRNYLLCSLKKDLIWQTPLDLNFQEGADIAFSCNGSGHVHLTGYLIPDDDISEKESSYDYDIEDEEQNVLEEKPSKRKAVDSLKDKKYSKRVKQELVESSDDDSDNEDQITDIEDSDGSLVQEEESSISTEDEEDEDEDEDEDKDKDECKYEDNTEQDKLKIKSQKPEKKGKNLEKQQQPVQQKKNDKQKLVNGKEVKQEQLNKQKKNKAEPKEQNIQMQAKKKVVEGGVIIEELKTGNGAPAKTGRFVSVCYTGRLKNGKKFDSAQGDGFKFRLGKGEVIKGWDVGINGMKVGGKRRITIPSNMAYGAKGYPPAIPSNSVLIFDVELKKTY